MMFVYIHDPHVYRQCDVTDNACIEQDSSADTSGGLHELKHISLLISLLIPDTGYPAFSKDFFCPPFKREKIKGHSPTFSGIAHCLRCGKK